METRTAVGPGMGLAIVKRLVEKEGGSIQLQSSERTGARFRVTWLKVTKQAESEQISHDSVCEPGMDS